MSEQQIKEKLLKSYRFLIKTGEGEGPLDTIFEILKDHPESVDLFIEKFHHPTQGDDLEVLAHIILTIKHYQPAIDYMRNELGEDDFTGYAGFPES